ncbi:MAG: GHKL domain-containing protein, partial [Eubacterium sp.]|nr:GHKL domain-containing protein [Eubacterium sp.]
VSFSFSSLLFEFIHSALFKQVQPYGYAHEIKLADLLANTLFGFAFSFLLAAVIKAVRIKKNITLNYDSKNIFFFLLPIIQIVIASQYFLLFNLLDNGTDLDINAKSIETIILVTYALCIGIDFLLIFMVDHIEKVQERNRETERLLVQNKMDYQQMIMLKEEKQEFRKIKHDFANITATAKGFIEIGKPEKAFEILNHTNDDLESLAGFSLCTNETINTIIYIKQHQASKNNIQLRTEINETAFVKIDDYDLCRALHNIIDNALNATAVLDENRECRISIEINADTISIESENKFNLVNNKKKKKSEEHGHGIVIINEMAKKYNGQYVSHTENNVYLTKTVFENITPKNSTPPEFWLNYLSLKELYNFKSTEICSINYKFWCFFILIIYSFYYNLRLFYRSNLHQSVLYSHEHSNLYPSSPFINQPQQHFGKAFINCFIYDAFKVFLKKCSYI